MRTTCQRGRRVETLQTAEEMVALYEKTHARKWNYAFVILDENLSDAGGVMFGSEGLKKMRQQGCDTRFIVCSCFCAPQDRKKYIKAGANAVWPKVSGCTRHRRRIRTHF